MKRRDFVKTVSAAGTGLLAGAPGWSWAQAGRPDVPMMRPAAKPDPEVKRVLVMFKCHFDAGFIDTQANVVKRYFSEYFPKAIEMAGTGKRGRQAALCVDHRIVAALRIPGAGVGRDRKTMEAAIGRGDIAWHALPFTWQTEMMDRR